MPEDFEVVNDAIKAKLQQLGLWLKGELPPGWGFTLLLFDYADGVPEESSMFYLSSANRADMAKAMREFLRKQEPH